MRNYIALLISMFMAPCLLSAQECEAIKAMSFNIRYDNPDDGKQNWHHRKENIVRMIQFYNPDLIGMQEVLSHQLIYLKENLPQFEQLGVGREDGAEKGEFSPVFYRKDKFESIRSGTFWLSETPEKVSKGWDAALERISSWVLLREKDSGKEFLFMNTHFDHRGDKARVESAKLIKQKSIELAGNRPLVLTGDFNLTPESKGIQSLLAEGEDRLQNSSSIATYTYGPEWTSTGFDNRPFEDRKVIDYIFVRNVEGVIRYAVLAEMLNELYLSDHTPVFAQIKL